MPYNWELLCFLASKRPYTTVPPGTCLPPAPVSAVSFKCGVHGPASGSIEKHLLWTSIQLETSNLKFKFIFFIKMLCFVKWRHKNCITWFVYMIEKIHFTEWCPSDVVWPVVLYSDFRMVGVSRLRKVTSLNRSAHEMLCTQQSLQLPGVSRN